MDQVTLVDEQKKDGLKLAERLAQQGFEVTAAFWLRTSEDGQWFLYFASPVVDSEGKREAYRRVLPVIRQMPQPFWVDPFEVVVRNADGYVLTFFFEQFPVWLCWKRR